MSVTSRLLLVAAASVAAAGAIAFGTPAAVAGPLVALAALLLVLAPQRGALAQAMRAVSTRQDQPRAVRIISRIGLGTATMAIGAAAAGVALKHEPSDVTAVISAPDTQSAVPLEPVTQLARRPREKTATTPTPTPTSVATVTPAAPVVPAAKPTKTTSPGKQPAPTTAAPSTTPQTPAPPEPTPTEDDSVSLLELLFGKKPKP